jgi:methionyl-tRNA synthetase
LFKGVTPSEPRELKVKDFEKIALTAKGGAVFCDALALEVNGKPVTCDVADGNGIH